jgi:hypothetical protein
MTGLSATHLLAIWERGAGQPAVWRALELLAAAFPKETPDSLAELAICERDARLLALRETIFGAQLNSLADCPACGECAEISFQASDLTAASRSASPGLEWSGAGWQVAYRLPSSRDMLAVHGTPLAEARRSLLFRCILSARQADQPAPADALPPDVLETLARQMAEADPLADVWFALACPACEHHWQAPFDVVAYVWSEVDAWALRTMQEVHCLARAYHWSEAEILNLSAWRRQLYLSML